MNLAPAMVESDLKKRVKGDVDFSELALALYSTDASIYKIKPIGVVHPKDTADVVAVVKYCYANDIPVIPRGGGSGLAGQAIGCAIILDFYTYMNKVIHLDVRKKTVTVQPGMNCDVLQNELRKHGLQLGAVPASSAMAAIGGMVGTNAKGAHSAKYGKVSDHLLGTEVVLSNGSTITVHNLSKKQLEQKTALKTLEGKIYRRVVGILHDHGAEIKKRFPRAESNSCGYNLKEVRDNGFDLNKVLCGSEGTLAVVTSATLQLVPIPAQKGGMLLYFKSVEAAASSVPTLLRYQADAVEFMDDQFFAQAKKHRDYSELMETIPKQTVAAILVEVSGDDEKAVAKKLSAIKRLRTRVHAFDVRIAQNASELAHLWKVRKAGAALLMTRTDDNKFFAFVEDSAVPPERLREYIVGFKRILKKYGTHATFYGHGSRGLLHIRPLANIKTKDGIKNMHKIATEVAHLAVRLGGTVSGEHGDGLARTEFIPLVYGEHVTQLFEEVKDVFDPKRIMNPGKIVAVDPDMRKNLRFGTNYSVKLPKSKLIYHNQKNLQQAAELCHGCGKCRTRETGIMCPTFMAEPKEFLATRGRANAINRAMSGDLPDGYLYSKEFKQQILDYCVGCKGCTKDCPSGVDMARLKEEMLYHQHKRNGMPLLYRIISNFRKLAFIASLVPYAGKVTSLSFVKRILAKIGIDKRRTLPEFRHVTFEKWFSDQPKVMESDVKVALYVDCFTNHLDPDVAAASASVLRKLGVQVELVSNSCCGRVKMSVGDLDAAQVAAQQNVARLAEYVKKGYTVVSCEPSCATMFQEDYRSLLPHSKDLDLVAENSFEIMEYLAKMKSELRFEYNKKTQSIVYHGHCHAKARKSSHHASDLLNDVPGTQCAELDSSCCGMAGFFGYTHFDLSHKIGHMLLDKIRARGHDNKLAATGFSCRRQLHDMGRKALHPIQYLNEVLVD